jgi:hypothetical protein
MKPARPSTFELSQAPGPIAASSIVFDDEAGMLTTDIRRVLTSRAFLLGVGMLIVAAVITVVPRSVFCPDGDAMCRSLTDLALQYRNATLLLPGAFVVAGLLARRDPFLTGFMLGLAYALVILVSWLIEQPTYSMFGSTPRVTPIEAVLAVAFVAVAVGTLVTGVAGRVAGRLYRVARER